MVRVLDDTHRPLVSVIVPIYNVERYVRKCLDSLKDQTLKQIEIIMVEDGSTDNSGEIAEEYVTTEECWPQFRLIRHDNNKGLSAARNTGIDEAKSGWLMFVDSDDWVESDFCEVAYNAAVENRVDMVIFNTIKDNELVDEFIAQEYGGVMAWNKIYKQDLFVGIRYPEGRVFEDVATTHKLVHKAKSILFLTNNTYHHFVRKESISHIWRRTNKRDCFLSAIERNYDLKMYGLSQDNYEDSLFLPAIGYLACMKDNEDELYKIAEGIINRIDRIPKEVTLKQQIATRVWKKNPRILYILNRIRRGIMD